MKFLLSGKKEELTDEQIIIRYKKDKDQYWVSVLFERYSHLAYAVSYNYLKDEEESKDVVLSFFQKLTEDLLKYEVRTFHSWLHSVIRNRCLRIIGKKIPHYKITENILPNQEEKEDQLAPYIDMLDECIEKLNTEQKNCIQLFYLKKKSYKEISDATGYDILKVKSYIQNGKRNLKIMLEEKDINE